MICYGFSTLEWVAHCTHQADEHTDELHDVGVGDRVEPSQQSVQQGNGRRNDDGQCQTHAKNHLQCSTFVNIREGGIRPGQ